MWPIQLAFRFLISCRIFLCSLTLSNTSSFLTWSVQLIFSILLQHHISFVVIYRFKMTGTCCGVSLWDSILEHSYSHSSSSGSLRNNPPQDFRLLQTWVLRTWIRTFRLAFWFSQLGLNFLKVKFGLLGTAKFTFRPMRISQHQEGRLLCGADRGRELECRDCFWYVGVRRTPFLIDLQNIVSHNKIYKSKLIYSRISISQGWLDVFLTVHHELTIY